MKIQTSNSLFKGINFTEKNENCFFKQEWKHLKYYLLDMIGAHIIMELGDSHIPNWVVS